MLLGSPLYGLALSRGGRQTKSRSFHKFLLPVLLDCNYLTVVFVILAELRAFGSL